MVDKASVVVIDKAYRLFDTQTTGKAPQRSGTRPAACGSHKPSLVMATNLRFYMPAHQTKKRTRTCGVFVQPSKPTWQTRLAAKAAALIAERFCSTVMWIRAHVIGGNAMTVPVLSARIGGNDIANSLSLDVPRGQA